ncbi:hypothetical protein R3P38DRAFT_3173029 [Favolaschia claudopus]|uniref:Transmembrane protein n=1 Tax=Favolaschia claudopus TaxID=2862362 RepID=A0AAW0DM51_9AGAR
MSLPPFKWRTFNYQRRHLTFCETSSPEVVEAQAEQAETHRLWPYRDRSQVSSHAEAVAQRNFWRGRLAAAAAVASIRRATRQQREYEEWLHRHALAVQPPGTELEWGSGAGAGGWGTADDDGGWGSTDWNDAPFSPELTTHVWSTTSYSNPSSTSLAWGSPSGDWAAPTSLSQNSRKGETTTDPEGNVYIIVILVIFLSFHGVYSRRRISTTSRTGLGAPALL